MAKCLRAPKCSFHAFVLVYIFMCSLPAAESNGVESDQVKNNDFQVSIKIINGKVDIKWNASSLWENTTVYFLSSLEDSVTNASRIVNFSVCHAFTQDKVSWKIEPIQNNLLEFCNRSRNCSPVEDKHSLVSAYGSEELSCQLFNMCSNLQDVFRIRVVSRAEWMEYSFESGNMTILSENIPPLYDFPRGREVLVLEDTPITIDYFLPSRLCGFGAKPTDNLQFIVNCCKVNDSKCFLMRQKIASYSGGKNEVTDVVIKKSDILYCDILVKSLASNKTSTSQRIKYITFDTATTRCSSTGGVVYISWRPQWNCFDKEVTELAEFCFYDMPCFRACEVSFFANGTFRSAVADRANIRNACQNRKRDCQIIGEPNEDIDFVNVTWSPETQRISCTLFTTCIDYRNSFSVKASSLNRERTIVNTLAICHERSELWRLNQPAVPQSVRAVDVQAEQVTITWKSPKCEIDVLICEVHLIFDGAETVVKEGNETSIEVTRDAVGLNYIYKLTKKELSPYKKVTFELYTKCSGLKKSERSPQKTVLTKMSAPITVPRMSSILYDSDSKLIKLNWEYDTQLLNGVPNETIVIGTVNGTVVYNSTVPGINRSKEIMLDNKKKRCAHYKVKICNAPHLCSRFSTPYQMPICKEEATTTPPTTVKVSSLNHKWVIMSVVMAAAVIIIASIFTYLCCQKQRKKMREKLPELESEKDGTKDYIPIGEVSRTGEYDRLDKEEQFDQLIKT